MLFTTTVEILTVRTGSVQSCHQTPIFPYRGHARQTTFSLEKFPSMEVIGQYVATPPFIDPLQIEHTSMKPLYPIIEPIEFCFVRRFTSLRSFTSEIYFASGASLQRFASLRSFTSEIRFASELHFRDSLRFGASLRNSVALLGFHRLWNAVPKVDLDMPFLRINSQLMLRSQKGHHLHLTLVPQALI